MNNTEGGIRERNLPVFQTDEQREQGDRMIMRGEYYIGRKPDYNGAGEPPIYLYRVNPTNRDRDQPIARFHSDKAARLFAKEYDFPLSDPLKKRLDQYGTSEMISEEAKA